MPAAPVGKPIAGANTPSAKSSRPNSKAFAASPTRIGVIGVSLGPVLNPSFFNLRLKNFVLAQSFLMSLVPASESSNSNAAWHDATTDGGFDVEKMNGLARW